MVEAAPKAMLAQGAGCECRVMEDGVRWGKLWHEGGDCVWFVENPRRRGQIVRTERAWDCGVRVTRLGANWHRHTELTTS